MCLYGNDLDETTTPVEAGLTWVIGMLLHYHVVCVPQYVFFLFFFKKKVKIGGSRVDLSEPRLFNNN